jgi:excisionase family DNA binding protein
MPDEPSDSSEEAGVQPPISLAEAAKISGFSQGYLRRLMREGKIRGTKIGRDWLTTEKAVKDYLSTERRPGPKPKDD